MTVTFLSRQGQVTWSRDQIEDMSAELASRLIARHGESDFLVAVVGDTSPESAVLARAALVAGIQITFLGMAGHSPGMMASLRDRLDRLQPDIIVGPGQEIRGLAAGAQRVAIEDLLDPPLRERSRRGAHDGFEPARFRLVQFTSGTTGHPSPVTISRDALEANLKALRRRFQASADDSIFSWLPLNHDMGLVGTVLLSDHLSCRLTFCAPSTFLAHPSMWEQWLTEARPTSIPAPNSGWSLLSYRAGGRDRRAMRRALESMRVAIIGAEPVDPVLCERLVEGPARLLPAGSLVPAYGLAEATLAVSAEPPGTAPVIVDVPGTDESSRDSRVVSAGIPLEGLSVSIRDGDRELGDLEIGEITVRGASLADEYRAEPGGLATGDEGFTMGSRLFVTGRRKDLIKVHGRRVFPHEIERAAEASGLVRRGRTVAFSIPSPPPERSVLLVEPAGGARSHHREMEDRLRSLVLQCLGVRLDIISVVEPGSIPKTTSGKLKRNDARSHFLAGETNVARSRC
ncbi:AMP-binding protein [Actinomadura latina]|uniref:Fatty acyl-AMP ligase n=1 Tax=Actinomadura latina TaxID=163603 RepID=A0A846YZU4_9ACTN|nr:AMP-binding protein [Actinomadura latina]NKZ06500.1 fatty acyl-AMP ligase [Actinomadura latina]